MPKVEKREGYPPTQKPLRLVRCALLASTKEGDLVFDPFCGSGTTAVTAKELNRAFVGAELEEEFAKLAARRVAATKRGSLLHQISEQFWNGGCRSIYLCSSSNPAEPQALQGAFLPYRVEISAGVERFIHTRACQVHGEEVLREPVPQCKVRAKLKHRRTCLGKSKGEGET